MARSFGSDNHSGVHPELLKAIEAANLDHAPSYGTDTYSEQLSQWFKANVCETATVQAVFNGTGANVVALRLLAAPPFSIIVSDVAHLHVDECGAPEHIAGAKLLTVPHKFGKISLDDLKQLTFRSGDQHFSQIKALSLTLPTEYGSCYSLEELTQLTSWARSKRLKVHIDGARIANALLFLNLDWKGFFDKVDFDVLSLGGTKNGLMMGELVVFKNKSEDFPYFRKQSLQLPSKTRFISAQFLHYFQSHLWKKIAQHSLDMAELLKNRLATETKSIKISMPRESNAVFAFIPRELIKELKDIVFFYVWDERTWECRLMTSWDTSLQDIDLFINKVKQLEEKYEVSTSPVP